jgi:hypothetical protein
MSAGASFAAGDAAGGAANAAAAKKTPRTPPIMARTISIRIASLRSV